MSRLASSLADDNGAVRFELEFGRDELGVAFIDLRAETALPLTCQRTLDRFELPVKIAQRLGLIVSEADEAALPPGYEALLVDNGEVRPADVIEDELILAVPVVPLSPAADGEGAMQWRAEDPSAPDEAESSRPNPFAALARLKKN